MCGVCVCACVPEETTELVLNLFWNIDDKDYTHESHMSQGIILIHVGIWFNVSFKLLSVFSQL